MAVFQPGFQTVAHKPSFLTERARTIRLSIRGGDLLLEGRFDHWVPLALDDSAVQLCVDVTGMTVPSEPRAEELFSVTAHAVDEVRPLEFAATGTIRRGKVKQPIQVMVQTPPAHTPFVVLTVPIDRAHFPEVWDELSAAVASRVSDAPLHPRGWLRMPSLAAA